MINCRLCLRSEGIAGKLQNSHVIPRFLIAKSKTRGRAIHFNATSKKIRETQEDWKEPLLCYDCEQFLSVSYENFLNDVLFLRRKVKSIYEDESNIVLRASHDRLALSLLSIFWRAAEASSEIFKLIAIPEYMREELRIWVYGNSMHKNWDKFVTIRVMRFKRFGDVDLPLLVSPYFHKNIKDECFDFIFLFGGFGVILKIPPSKNFFPRRDKSLWSSGTIVRISKINFSEVPGLHGAFVDFLEKIKMTSTSS